jgi:hypothetical protein
MIQYTLPDTPKQNASIVIVDHIPVIRVRVRVRVRVSVRVRVRVRVRVILIW